MTEVRRRRDVTTLEMLAAVSILREHLLELKIFVTNVVDLTRLQPHAGDKGIALNMRLHEKLIEHRRYINKNDQDLPEIRDWTLQS